MRNKETSPGERQRFGFVFRNRLQCIKTPWCISILVLTLWHLTDNMCSKIFLINPVKTYHWQLTKDPLSTRKLRQAYFTAIKCCYCVKSWSHLEQSNISDLIEFNFVQWKGIHKHRNYIFNKQSSWAWNICWKLKQKYRWFLNQNQLSAHLCHFTAHLLHSTIKIQAPVV